jgi:hypothetical protein
LENFGILSPTISYNSENIPIVSYNTGVALTQGSMNSVLVDQFKWIVKDPSKVDFSKDLFTIVGYDPAQEQKVPVKEVVENDRSGMGLLLWICLLVILLIAIFVVFCVFCGKGAAKRRRRDSEQYEEDGKLNEEPLIQEGQ